jgi:hypothetical protein
LTLPDEAAAAVVIIEKLRDGFCYQSSYNIDRSINTRFWFGNRIIAMSLELPVIRHSTEL